MNAEAMLLPMVPFHPTCLRIDVDSGVRVVIHLKSTGCSSHLYHDAIAKGCLSVG